MAIDIEFPYKIDVSPERSREGTSEGQQTLYHFEDVSTLLLIQRELFNILVSERRLIHRELRNKYKLMNEFDTGDLMVVRKKVKPRRKSDISQNVLFKIKGSFRFLEKAKPISYWLQYLLFCEGLGSPGRKVKEAAASMEKIPSTMVLHNHVDGSDTRFSFMYGPLVNNPLVKWLGVIIRGTYQSASENRRWEYEPVYDLCPYIEAYSDSISDGSNDE